MIKFSVLMSLYHKEKPEYLIDCLNSIINQSYQADEICIVFDGYIPEPLKNIVKNYQAQLPIKIIQLDKNMGLGKALNEGIKHCTNEWIFRMDTDDVCVSDRFEKQATFIQNNPDISLLGGYIEEFDETMQHSYGIRIVPTQNAQIIAALKKRNTFNHMTVAYKKSSIESVGGYQHHLYMEDYNLWLRVLASGYKTCNLPEVLVKARTGMEMYARRKGVQYIISEYQLAKLKIALKLQPSFSAYSYFLMRSLPRLLPTKILGKIYSILRKQ